MEVLEFKEVIEVKKLKPLALWLFVGKAFGFNF